MVNCVHLIYIECLLFALVSFLTLQLPGSFLTSFLSLLFELLLFGILKKEGSKTNLKSRSHSVMYTVTKQTLNVYIERMSKEVGEKKGREKGEGKGKRGRGEKKERKRGKEREEDRKGERERERGEGTEGKGERERKSEKERRGKQRKKRNGKVKKVGRGGGEGYMGGG